MKRVEITGFSTDPRCGIAGQTKLVKEAFLEDGFTFPIFGRADKSQDDLFIDGDQSGFPWALSAFVYHEIEEKTLPE
jgi:hypothetical protein